MDETTNLQAQRWQDVEAYLNHLGAIALQMCIDGAEYRQAEHVRLTEEYNARERERVQKLNEWKETHK